MTSVVMEEIPDMVTLAVDFRADVPSCVFIAFVLVKDGMKMNLVLVSPLHQFGYYTCGFTW